MFVRKSIFSSRVEDFFYHKISSILFKAGMLLGEMTISVSGKET
ncbi:hypothetical protein KDK67_11715 [Methanococcoides seepicolus]|uniref:Uncharacterized protein n=1 Tax=Methanococcoides seepicolus TaxID=2828780 RepID=A0A9E4ZH96_9EURY|nr:hypothetical protein [Methanococcoides seepicolus]